MDPGQEEQEKEEKENFPQGVLSQLCVLESRARRGAVAQELRERLREKREFRDSRLRELRRRRERLRDGISHARLGNSGIWDPREVLEWKIRNCRDRLRVFQLTGISGHVSSRGVCFSFHPASQGSCLQSFQLEFWGNFGNSPKFRLGRHCLPPFIPLEKLCREFLPQEFLPRECFPGECFPRERFPGEFFPGEFPPRDLGRFLGILFQHVNAFAGRRHQLDESLEEFPDIIRDVPARNSLCNLLSFRYRIPGKNPEIPKEIPGKNPKNPEKIAENPKIPGKNPKIPENFLEFRARLLYEDPLRSLPTRVDISAEGGSAAPLEHRELFQNLPLPRALGALAPKKA